MGISYDGEWNGIWRGRGFIVTLLFYIFGSLPLFGLLPLSDFWLLFMLKELS